MTSVRLRVTGAAVPVVAVGSSARLNFVLRPRGMPTSTELTRVDGSTTLRNTMWMVMGPWYSWVTSSCCRVSRSIVIRVRSSRLLRTVSVEPPAPPWYRWTCSSVSSGRWRTGPISAPVTLFRMLVYVWSCTPQTYRPVEW